MSVIVADHDSSMERFHRSLYLTLAVACICLIYSEWLFLPEMVIIGLVVGGMMFVAYRLEGRWALSLRAANLVGALIAIILALWAGYQFIRPQMTLLEFLPWPASLLPYLGPLVLILIPAKLFRPKHAGDYWSLQLIGLMTVALACALASDGIMGILVSIYAVGAVCCVADFHAVVHRKNCAPVSVRSALAEHAATVLPVGHAAERPTSLLRIGAWAFFAAIMAILLSLITPRSIDAQWGLGGISNRLKTGYSEEKNQIDLNLSGELEPSSEIAFEVRAETVTGEPKLDLSSRQRWRGTTFNFYDHGKWSNRGWSSRISPPGPDDRRIPRIDEVGNARLQRERMARTQEIGGNLPDLGPEMYYLIFASPSQPRGTFFLADPLWPPRHYVGPYLAAPVVSETDTGMRMTWRARLEGDAFPPSIVPGHWNKLHYRQATAPTPEPNLSVPVNIDPAFAEHLTALTQLRHLRKYATGMMQKLLDDGQLPKMVGWSPGLSVPSEHHEEVARAIDHFLRHSGQFEYSLSLNRVDSLMDPIEDFLLNSRQGHCNRFSTALALLLRSQGIPSRIVLGFEGCESNGDGTYVVRQANAHSWVESLVRRPVPSGERTWHWLTLDPTPATERLAIKENAIAKWLEDVSYSIIDLLKNFVLNLNADRQEKMQSSIAGLSPLVWGPGFWNFLKTPGGWATVGALAATIWWIRKRKMRGGRDRSNNGFEQLRTMLDHQGLVPISLAMTPLELGRRFAEAMPAPNAAVSGAAGRIIHLHDQARYAGQSTSAAESLEAATALKTISQYLRKQPRRKQSSLLIGKQTRNQHRDTNGR